MLGKPAFGGVRAGKEHEWVLFLQDPSVAVWVGAEGQQADQGRGTAVVQVGDGGGPDQVGGREGTGV